MSYAPIPGTIPYKAIEFLATLNHEWIATAPLMEAIGHPGLGSFATNIDSAVRHGVVESRKKKGSNSYEWRLAIDVKPLPPRRDTEPPEERPPFVLPNPAISSPFRLAKTVAVDQPQTPKQAQPDGFVCALYNDGRLLIKSGDVEHTLPTDHTRALLHYLDHIDAGATNA